MANSASIAPTPPAGDSSNRIATTAFATGAVRQRLAVDTTYFVRTVPVTVTLTIANPGVVTWTNHGLVANATVAFNTTGSLPTGLTVGTIYFVVGSSITVNSFQVSLTQGGASINFTGAQAGTQTAQTGSDTNSGADNTAAHALMTVQRYVTIVNQLIDLNGHAVVGQLAHGQYNESVNLFSYVGRGAQGHTTPTIQGDAAAPTACIINAVSGNAVIGVETGGFEWVLRNLQVQAAAGNAVDSDVGSWIVLDGVTFGASTNAIIASGGIVEFVSPCTWAGNMVSCGIQTSNKSLVLDTGNAHVISNTPSWGSSFLLMKDGCQGYFPPPCSFTGASTGTRWNIDASSFVDTGGVGFDTLFPGNANGSYTPIEVRRGGTAANTASGTSLDNITGFSSTGFLKRTGAGAYSFIADPLPVANGGTAAAAASGTALDNITGFNSTGFLRRTGAGAYTFDAPGQMLATATNDNAAAGDVGEFVTSTIAIGSAVGLSTGTPANITSISLTAGDWDVWIVAAFTGGATTTVNYLIGSISTTSATLSGGPPSQQNVPCFGQVTFNQSNTFSVTVGLHRLSLSITTTVYFVAQASFATSTCSGFGTLSARRRR